MVSRLLTATTEGLRGIPTDLRDRVTRFLQYAYHSQTECTSDSDVPLLKLLSKAPERNGAV